MPKFEHFVYTLLVEERKKKLVLLFTLLALVLAVLLFPSKIVLAKMLPAKSANTFSIYVDLPSGSSYQQTNSVNACIVAILQKEKEIRNMELFNGMGSPLDYAGLVKGSGFKSGEQSSEIVVNLSGIHEREERSFSMVHRLRPLIQKSCESIVAHTSIKMVEQPAGPPTMAAVVVELYGEKSERLNALAEKIKEILVHTKDLVDVDILSDEVYEKFALVLDQEKVNRSYLNTAQIHELLYLAFEGMKVAHKNSETSPEQIPLYVVLSASTKSLLTASKETLSEKLSELKLRNTEGLMVPLGEVVRVEKVASSPSIMSKNLQKMVSIVAEADLVSQVYPLLEARSKIKELLSAEFEISRSHLFDLTLKDKKSGDLYTLVWDGEMKVTMDTFRDLGGAFIAALVLIFLLMVVYYKSFALSGIVLLGSFLSIIGVILGHWIMDLFSSTTFFLTATSLIGFISLMGISSRNALLLIDFAQTLMKQGVQKKEAIARASATRAKPIMLTAAAIILASTLLATDPIFGGLGVALIFGTIVAVIVSLIVVPVLLDTTKAL